MGKVKYDPNDEPYRFAVYEVNAEHELPENFPLIYSQMKYGYPPAVRYMAEIFSNRIMNDEKVMQIARDEGGLMIAGSVYLGVPRGATVLGWEVARILNQKGIPTRNFKINYKGDHNTLRGYAAMDSVNRGKILSQFDFWLSKTCLRQVRNKTLLVLDDACMTGVHEKMVYEALKDTTAQTTVFGYLINFSPWMAEHHPHYEEKLNQFGEINPLDSLAKMLIEIPGEPTLYINARTIRIILSAPEKGWDVLSFYQKLSDNVLLKIYEAAVSKDGYSRQIETAKGFEILKYYILARGLKKSLTFRTGLEVKEDLRIAEKVEFVDV